MAQESFPFDAQMVDGLPDRVYSAEDWSTYFKQFLSTGIYHTNQNATLPVTTEGTDMSVDVGQGSAMIEGYMYRNTASINMPIEAADASSPRMDRVVLRLDSSASERSVQAQVKRGTPASTPAPPLLERAGYVYEIALADIYVGAGVTSIQTGNITDQRFNEDVAGLVKSLIGDQYILDQLEAHMESYVKHPGFAVAGGSANAYTATLDPAPPSYVNGLGIALAINVDSTATSTLDVNGLGAKTLLKSNGNPVKNLKQNGVYTFRYFDDGSTSAFILQGEGGEGTATAAQVLEGETFTNDEGVRTGNMVDYSGQDLIIGPTHVRKDGNYLQFDVTEEGKFDTSSSLKRYAYDLQSQNIKSGVNLFGVTGSVKEWDGVMSNVSGYNSDVIPVDSYSNGTEIFNIGMTPGYKVLTYLGGENTFTNNILNTNLKYIHIGSSTSASPGYSMDVRWKIEVDTNNGTYSHLLQWQYGTSNLFLPTHTIVHTGDRVHMTIREIYNNSNDDARLDRNSFYIAPGSVTEVFNVRYSAISSHSSIDDWQNSFTGYFYRYR